MSLTPTDEQAAALEAFGYGVDMKIEAFAGTGKTSTLKMLARSTTDPGVYLGYNASTAADARGSFPPHVECRTTHSFAYRWLKTVWGEDALQDRLNGSRMPAYEIARLLGIRGALRVGEGAEARALNAHKIARVVLDTIQSFCQSADPEITADHVRPVRGFEAPEARAELIERVMPVVRTAWEDITRPAGKLRFAHDHYLKMWALTNPVLPADYVLLDEAQDTNPVVAGIFENQRGQAQLVAVGDSNQAIYGWRGATDFLATMEAEEHLYLTESFRFGPAVAGEANKWLRLLGVERPVIGHPLLTSILCPLERPDAVLCRTNAEAVATLMRYQTERVPVCIVGGGFEFKKLAEAARELQEGGSTMHSELAAFSSWGQVREYVTEAADGADLRVAVDLIDEWGAGAIIKAIDSAVREDEAAVVVSTAHKAKGREWERVKIAEDFRKPDDTNGRPTLPMREEMMLAYVSVTRARQMLDPRGLEWVNDYVAHANYARLVGDTGWESPAAS